MQHMISNSSTMFNLEDDHALIGANFPLQQILTHLTSIGVVNDLCYADLCTLFSVLADYGSVLPLEKDAWMQSVTDEIDLRRSGGLDTVDVDDLQLMQLSTGEYKEPEDTSSSSSSSFAAVPSKKTPRTTKARKGSSVASCMSKTSQKTAELLKRMGMATDVDPYFVNSDSSKLLLFNTCVFTNAR